MHHLPIDDILPELTSSLQARNSVVIQAPPGAGKTTRIPLALLDAPWLGGKGIVMLEPRRLAATNAARWMASTLGEDVGGTVGYTIRFDRKVSRRTRLEVVTEGVLTRRLQSDSFLEGVGAVIFDEFHERSIHADLALALCRDVQQGLREDLRIIVMSATLDAAPVAALLDDAPVITSEGRIFPVDIRYLSEDYREPLPAAVARSVRLTLAETEGDILAFLPGAREIRRCRQLLEDGGPLPTSPVVTPLYGDLSFADQERAIVPAKHRKVILATNIAETSLTIEGVRVVIDSGYCRRLRFDPATGLDRLVTERISAASATQRAGRAGRLGPGTCLRLWSEHIQRTLIPTDPPEIATSDLTPVALDLAAWGVTDPASLAWLTPLPQAAYQEAQRLLVQLDAINSNGVITDTGRSMAELPVHPRLAHMLIKAAGRGLAYLACDVAAILSERDIVKNIVEGDVERSESDMLLRIEALHGWRSQRRLPSIDAAACRTVDRAAHHLRKLLNAGSGEAASSIDGDTVSLLLAWAYPDRIAMLRGGEGRRYLLSGGRGAVLSGRSRVHSEPLVVAYEVERGERGDDLIRQASALAPETLRREFAGGIVRVRTVEWDDREGRVSSREEERFGALILESRPAAATAEEVQNALVEGIVRGPGLQALRWSAVARRFMARVRLMARLFPDEGWPDLSEEKLLATLGDWLGPYLDGARRLSDVAAVDLMPLLQALLPWNLLRRLDEGAPTHLAVPSGSRISLDYGEDGTPVLAVKLQEMFGLADTPTVAWGRVPVLIHLLSPAGRPLQVTADLRGFWNGAYQEVKKEMRGRYPKHPWPDDPWTAVPTRKTKRHGE